MEEHENQKQIIEREVQEECEKAKEYLTELSNPNELEPNNLMCCKYFNDVIESGEVTVDEASNGDKEFGERQKQYLCNLLAQTLDGKRGKRDCVLELMSGNGNKRAILNRFFVNVEMIEQSKKMTENYPKDILLHQMRIQEFDWLVK